MLELTFDDGLHSILSCEYLRVHSPSAEVRGHSAAQAVLQVHKEDVGIKAIEPIGNYAVRLVFDDGHDSGLYSWDTLYDLAKNRDANWMVYIKRLADAGINHG